MIADGRPFDAAWVVEQVGALTARGLVADAVLTEDGHATADRLMTARKESIRSLVADWEPDGDPRVNEAVDRLCRELAREYAAA